MIVPNGVAPGVTEVPGTPVGRGVGFAVGLGVAVAVGFGVAVAVGVGVGVGGGVGAGVGVGEGVCPVTTTGVASGPNDGLVPPLLTE